MGHHGSGRGFGDARRGTHLSNQVLGPIPRGLKLGLVVVALFIGLLVLAIGVLVVLLLVKLVAGGSLPSYMENAVEFLQRNLQPLLNLWKSVQSLAGK